jgi:hypothetical protein
VLIAAIDSFRQITFGHDDAPQRLAFPLFILSEAFGEAIPLGPYAAPNAVRAALHTCERSRNMVTGARSATIWRAGS